MDNDIITTTPATEPGELKLASLIRPLPQEVAPSDEFLRRMRGRLLRLSSRHAKPADQAA